jgi:8-amino-7-oxononanoate synthase
MKDHVQRELPRIEAEGLLRRTVAWPEAGGKIRLADGRTLLNFSSNDYLDLATDEQVKRRAIEAILRWGCGATASRLMCGTLEIHEQLEAALARWVGGDAGLVFGSGFATNVGLLFALVGREDVIFADRLSHASLIDGARLSGATLKRFAHNDPCALIRALDVTPCRRRRFIVTESVFSMDGDTAPLPELLELAARYEATLLVDEAHAIGVWGGGGGRCRALGCPADLTVGTLGKALGSHGGFVVCSAAMREYLVNRARSFIYSTALPPASVAAALAALERITHDEAMGDRLLDRARTFHRQLTEEGLRVAPFCSQILPVHVDDNQRAVALAERLRAAGLLVTAIRPPTVPTGTARIRLSVTLAHSPEDLAWAAATIGRVVRESETA